MKNINYDKVQYNKFWLTFLILERQNICFSSFFVNCSSCWIYNAPSAFLKFNDLCVKSRLFSFHSCPRYAECKGSSTSASSARWYSYKDIKILIAANWFVNTCAKKVYMLVDLQRTTKQFFFRAVEHKVNRTYTMLKFCYQLSPY